MMGRDWNGRACAKRGHVTFAPSGAGTEDALRGRLRAETASGEAWRCLRCGDFALGPATLSGTVESVPEVLRGKALRDHFILRVLAVERIVRGAVIFLIAVAVWKFAASQDALSQLFEKDLSVLSPVAHHWGYDLDHATIVDRIRKTFGYKRSTLHLAAFALAAYAALETVEGLGLWRARRWGEYLTAVGTSIFLPLEIWDGYTKVHDHKSWMLALGTFTVNIAAVGYLLVTKRLFGIRGGGPAFEARRHADSLLTSELAACAAVPDVAADSDVNINVAADVDVDVEGAATPGVTTDVPAVPEARAGEWDSAAAKTVEK